MDKVILNKDQLRTLKEFIHSRGFHDPIVVVEILDHFACMVEDRMEQNSNLTLEDAMYDAHKELGIMGFRYIAANLEKGYRLKYRRTYWKNLKETVTSPLPLLIVLLGLFSLYFVYMNYRHVEVGIFSIFDILFVVYVLSLVLAGINRYRLYKKNYKSKHRFYTEAFKSGSISLFIIPQFAFIHSGPNPPESLLYVAATAFALLATWCFLDVYVFFKTMGELIMYYKRPFQLFTELTD